MAKKQPEDVMLSCNFDTLIQSDEHAGHGGTFYVVDGRRIPEAEYLKMNELKEASDGEQTDTH